MSCYNLARTNMIKNILQGNNLKSLIDLDCNDTESFINTKKDIDIRDVLDKKILDFSEVINKIGGIFQVVKYEMFLKLLLEGKFIKFFDLEIH